MLGVFRNMHEPLSMCYSSDVNMACAVLLSLKCHFGRLYAAKPERAK